MTISRHNASTSRGSVSRPASAARNIIQRRDKPYRTEKATVLEAKRKLDLQTSYAKAPPGYTFVQFGTPDLSDRCKEVSRSQGRPVYIVNAKPMHKFATDPDKVSNHVHRIGYHFDANIVDDVCLELGYTVHKGRYVKESDLEAQNTQSRTAQIMAKHGLAMEKAKSETREDTDYLRSSIKELFPKMPDQDLEAIIKHAWEDGSLRVGTNANLGLPRRIQLATIARIRHTYTDYDVLLKAFGDWAATRKQVEPDCLAKLKEWRGENVHDDADEHEWITREYIVIDDDDELDETANRWHDADDEGSDSSVEITHYQAREEDLGAESSNETAQRYLDRLYPRRYIRPDAETQQRPTNFFTAHSRPQSNGDIPSFRATSPGYHQQMLPRTRVTPSQPGNIQYENRSQEVGNRYDRPIMLYSPPPPIRGEYAQIPLPAVQNYTIPTAALPHAVPAPNTSDEIVINGQIYRRLPAAPEFTHQQPSVPTHPPQDLSRHHPPLQPSYNSYTNVLPSIENHTPPQPQARVGWHAPYDPRFAEPHRTPPPLRQRVEYIDLTSPQIERRPAPLPPPVHGAPAPIQQVPRGGYYG